MRANLFFLCLLTLFSSSVRAAGSSLVGNGDDGTDLEGAKPVTSGILIEARDTAMQRLKALNTAGIPGLGLLLPEVTTSPLYLATQDVNAIDAKVTEDQGRFHSDMRGLVYARTFAHPHAATRFFPVATKLELDQLVALTIHEGLHRSLPPAVREDEAAVTRLTLAITAPGATHDQVSEVAGSVIPAETRGAARAQVVEEDHFGAPSSIGYQFRYFLKPDEEMAYPITAMHVLHSHLYPFGGANAPLGLGIEGAFIHRPAGALMGPLSLSARLRVWSHRGFDVGVFGVASLNTLSPEELKNSPYGRDVFTLGLSLRKDFSSFYVENFLSVGFGGESKHTLGLVSYDYSYGAVVTAKIRGGYRVWKLDLGGFAELNLAGSRKISGGAFNYDSGRYRILAVGPEAAFTTDRFSVALSGRFLVDATNGANFDYLGNLMGAGVSQGSIGLSGSLFF